jgi:hypothetical protein
VDGLLRQMLRYSDNASANALEVWLGGSTSGGSGRIDALLHSIGLHDTIMYGGYELNTYRPIPARIEEQPSFGVGKYTTAYDLSTLFRDIWLASGGKGPLREAHPGFSAADARYLIWLLAHVSDAPKLDRFVGRSPSVAVVHKAGWIDSARHDAGLVFWPGGVFVASVMTWSPYGMSTAADTFAGRCSAVALARFRHHGG